MSLLLKFVANKKLKEIQSAMQSGNLLELTKAADMDLNDPMFAEMSMDEGLEVIRVRLADRLKEIELIKRGKK